MRDPFEYATWTYIHIYENMYICTYVIIYIYIYIHTYINLYLFICLYVDVCNCCCFFLRLLYSDKLHLQCTYLNCLAWCILRGKSCIGTLPIFIRMHAYPGITLGVACSSILFRNSTILLVNFLRILPAKRILPSMLYVETTCHEIQYWARPYCVKHAGRKLDYLVYKVVF